jgi:phosphoglucomutase
VEPGSPTNDALPYGRGRVNLSWASQVCHTLVVRPNPLTIDPSARPYQPIGGLTMHPRAGHLATPDDLIDIPALITAYYELHPDPAEISQQVAFGTSGHRGSAFDRAFNDDHIAATTQAICDYRASAGIGGPLFIGRDPHALSEPAWVTALEVLAGNGVTAMIDSGDGFTPTPAISHAILVHNRGLRADAPARADGIVVTSSHNPPRDGGFKYNPPDGGPAGTDITSVVQAHANELLTNGLRGVRRTLLATALAASTTKRYDYLRTYVDDLPNVIDLDTILAAGVRIGADPLGGASVEYWPAIAETYGLDLTVLNPITDPTWRFMHLDWDGKIRMDCSSPHTMAPVIARRADFDISTGNDADSDRHGIVTSDYGLMNPNHFLATCIDYLVTHRPGWRADSAIGKTVVSSSMIDRVVASHGRTLFEVPVGFKWYVPGLLDGSVAFGGEESAGASFLRRDGGAWSTDKDGIIACLLAAEILAVTDSSPSEQYARLTEKFGNPSYARIDAVATRAQKTALAKLSPAQVTATSLAGEPIIATMTQAPGNHAAIGGLKVMSENGWFAARPSGTEDVYKIYAESFTSAEHLVEIQAEAQEIVTAAIS